MQRQEKVVDLEESERFFECLDAKQTDDRESTGDHIEQTRDGDVGEEDVLGFTSHGWERDDGMELEGVAQKPENPEKEEDEKSRHVEPLSFPQNGVPFSVDMEVVGGDIRDRVTLGDILHTVVDVEVRVLSHVS